MQKYIPNGIDFKQEGNVFSYAIDSDCIVETCKELYFTHKLQLQTLTAVDKRNDGDGFEILYVFGSLGKMCS